jgi:type II secretory pathway component GspD/PulD (secretin)
MSSLPRFVVLFLAGVLAAVAVAQDGAPDVPAARLTVIRQLEDLLRPARTGDTPPPAAARPAVPPYLHVVPGEDGRSTLIYRCRFVKAAILVDAMESIISSTGMVEKAESQNLIIVNDLSAKMDELRLAVQVLDVNSPQILVEAKVVEVFVDEGMERELEAEYQKYDAAENLTSTFGTSLGDPSPNPLPGQGGGFDFFPYSSGREGGDTNRMRIFLRWLEHARDVRILSSPNLIVDLGTTASIITGEEIPIQSSQVVGGAVSTSIEFKRIGVKLNVTPEIINPDEVRLTVNPDVSTVSRFVTFQQAGVTFNNPIVSIRNVRTTLTVKDGEIIMLGGLYASEEITSVRRPPYVKNIPLLAELLSSKSESKVLTQLVFFLKVHILAEGMAGGMTAYDPERAAADIQGMGRIIKGSPVIFPFGNEPPPSPGPDTTE